MYKRVIYGSGCANETDYVELVILNMIVNFSLTDNQLSTKLLHLSN